MGFIDKSGAWYSYKNEKIGQGKDNVRTYLKEHAHLAQEIEQMIRKEFLTNQRAVPVEHDHTLTIDE